MTESGFTMDNSDEEEEFHDAVDIVFEPHCKEEDFLTSPQSDYDFSTGNENVPPGMAPISEDSAPVDSEALNPGTMHASSAVRIAENANESPASSVFTESIL
ncbi:uncharacterized protein LOC120438867 isoform X3 [Oreochromis aureus]|uniref:uncharacterized protein LOC120438867 isoform X3 n=1 Tax=Oreochromis aureus TaxID=47969 RepID=UPI0019549C1B|nr:uncharacterized protein LOC120438867 isoform X3 [Oreochromis aureus]